MKEIHKMYIEVLEEEIKEKSNNELVQAERIGDDSFYSSVQNYIDGIQFALDKAKGILPL
jgi:hypothetical protein